MYYIQYNWRLALISIMMFVIMFAIAKPFKTYKNPRGNNVKKGVVAFYMIFALNNVFAFWEYDTYHYWDTFLQAGRNGVIEIFEDFYNWLALKCNNNFFLWRACIWSTASWFMYITAKRLNTLNRNLLVSVLLFGSMLSVSRGMLGHTMLVLATVMIGSTQSTTAEKWIGLMLFICSYFLHKSMYVNIAFAIIALYPWDRYTIRLSWIAFPFLITIVTALLNNVVSGTLLGALDDGISNASASYASDDRMVANTFGMITSILKNGPHYIVLFYLVDRITFKGFLEGVNNERLYTYLYRLAYVSIYIASLFIFINTSSWLYVRFKMMALFPLVFVFARILSLETKANKWIKVIVITQLFSMSFELLFRLYKWFQL